MKLNRRAFRVRPGMSRGLQTEVPLPTRLVSNEEFPPLPQTVARDAWRRGWGSAGAISCARAAAWRRRFSP